MASTRRGLYINDAFDPTSGGVRRVLIPTRLIEHAVRQGARAARELGYTVPEVLKNPTAVLTYNNPDEADDPSWCYVGRPLVRYVGEHGSEAPAPPNRVFQVLASPSGNVYPGGWWVEADAWGADLPTNWDQAPYLEVLWSRTRASSQKR